MKSFLNAVLTFILTCLIVLLCLNLSIETMSTKAITNALVGSEASDKISKEIKGAFPSVSDEQIADVNKILVEHGELNQVVETLLDQVSKPDKIDTSAITDDLSNFLDKNIPEIESALGQKLPQDKIERLQKELTSEQGLIQNKISTTLNKVQNASTDTKEVLHTYNILTSLTTRIVVIAAILITVILLGLVNRSYFKWMRYGGRAALIAGVIVAIIMPFVIKALETKVADKLLGTTLNIPVTSLRVIGLGSVIIAMLLMLGYFILNRKYPTYRRNYY